MLNKSALSVAIIAGLLVAQSASNAVAGGLSFNLNFAEGGLSITAGPDGVHIDAGTPGAGDPDYDDDAEDTHSDEDVAADDEAVVE